MTLKKTVGTVAAALGGAVSGWIVYSKAVINHQMPLPPAVDAERHTFTGPRTAHQMNYYADTSGTGRPLVLVHSINAGASAYEMRPIFQQYRGQRPVYALELPGFGFSDRPDREYSWRLFTDSIHDFLAEIVREPADVVALSLSGEFAARAAHEQPDRFHSLTMISPTGFRARKAQTDAERAQQQNRSRRAYSMLSNPMWSQPFVDLLATRPSIYYFLNKSFEGAPDNGLVRYCYLTTHQPGARFAPLYFVSGQLFSRDIREAVYEKLTLPVLVIYDQDGYSSFELLPAVAQGRDNWHLTRVVPTRGMPHFEKLPEFSRALDNFWTAIGSSANATGNVLPTYHRD